MEPENNRRCHGHGYDCLTAFVKLRLILPDSATAGGFPVLQSL